MAAEKEKRLIDANAVKERIWYGNSDPSGLRQYASGFIDNAPTVDAVEVVHGRWLRIGSNGKLSGKRVWHYVCSECKTLGSPQWKCCPVCTARMDGDGNGTTKD